MTLMHSQKSIPPLAMSAPRPGPARALALAEMLESAANSYQTSLPPALVSELLRYRQTSTQAILSGDHSALSQRLSDDDLRTEALVTIAVPEGEGALPRGSRVVLCAALFPYIQTDGAVYPVIAGEVARDPKDYIFLTRLGELTRALSDVEIRGLGFCLVADILPLYVKSSAGKSDSWITAWTDVFCRLGYNYTAGAIEPELQSRAEGGRLSGYSHLLQVVRSYQPEETASVFDRLLRNATGVMHESEPTPFRAAMRVFFRCEQAALMTSLTFVTLGTVLSTNPWEGPLKFIGSPPGYLALGLPQLFAVLSAADKFLHSLKPRAEVTESKLVLAQHCIDELCGKLQSIAHVRRLLDTVEGDKRMDDRVLDYLDSKRSP